MYMSLLWFCQLCFVIFCKTERQESFVPTPQIFILENNWASLALAITSMLPLVNMDPRASRSLISWIINLLAHRHFSMSIIGSGLINNWSVSSIICLLVIDLCTSLTMVLFAC